MTELTLEQQRMAEAGKAAIDGFQGGDDESGVGCGAGHGCILRGKAARAACFVAT